VKSKGTFNKKIFAFLLEKAKGERTSRQFASDCGISYVQLHKLEMGLQENAPGIKLMTKLAASSAGGIELEDYLLAAGRIGSQGDEKPKKSKTLNIQQMYDSLSASQRKTVYDFMDYLANYKK